MNPVPDMPDLARMTRERRARLAAAMAAADVPLLLLLGRANVRYATGADFPSCDAGHVHQAPTLAVVSCDDPVPHVFTPDPELCAASVPAARVHPAVHPECAAGVEELARRLRDVLGGRAAGRVAVDETTVQMRLRLGGLLPGLELVDALPVMAAARIVKTPDEVACIRRAQAINDRAMLDVEAALGPGLRPCDLSGLFLRRIAELGASGNVVDPIWQVMPARQSDGPFTVNGEIAFPLPSGVRPLAAGDVVWVDTGISYHGYVSDFGRTWIAGAEPSRAQRELFARWRAVLERALEQVRPGATGADLTRAARAGEPRTPWLRHLYLAHGAGLDSAEMPLVGTDLGEAFDSRVVLEPGMVLVFEPVVWEDGASGYRAEEVVVVTDGGYERLSAHPYAPFA